MTTERVFIYFIEGTHGVGKTTLLKALKQVGFMTVDEDFMGKYSGFLSSPSHAFLTEAAWAGDCLNKVIKKADKLRKYRKIGVDSFRGNAKIDKYCQLPPVIFVDRSYITGLIYGTITDPYARNLYEHFCVQAIDTLEDNYNIEPYFVRIKIEDLNEHIEKVIKRAAKNKTRQTLNELDTNFLSVINDRYENYDREYKCDFDGLRRGTAFDYIYINKFSKIQADDMVTINLGPFLKEIDLIEDYMLPLNTLVQIVKLDE